MPRTFHWLCDCPPAYIHSFTVLRCSNCGKHQPRYPNTCLHCEKPLGHNSKECHSCRKMRKSEKMKKAVPLSNSAS